MNDARMNLDILFTATVDKYKEGFVGANILNYTTFREFIKDDKG